LANSNAPINRLIFCNISVGNVSQLTYTFVALIVQTLTIILVKTLVKINIKSAIGIGHYVNFTIVLLANSLIGASLIGHK